MNTTRLNFADFCERSDCNKTGLDAVLSKVQNGAWIAGGAVRRTLIKHTLDSDFDFFFRDEAHLEDWERKLPATMNLIRETEHHKHYRGIIEGSSLPIDVQAIRFRFYATAEEVIDSFDYTITQFCLDGDDLVTTPTALWDLGRRKLAIHKVTYPVATLRRLLKYSQQGFTACSGCMAQLMRDTASSPAAMASLDLQYVD